MNQISYEQASAILGVAEEEIRKWVALDLLTPHYRTPQEMFNLNNLARLVVIKRLVDFGLGLDSLRLFLRFFNIQSLTELQGKILLLSRDKEVSGRLFEFKDAFKLLSVATEPYVVINMSGMKSQIQEKVADLR